MEAKRPSVPVPPEASYLVEDVVRHEGEAADPGLPGRARALRAPPPPQRHVLRGRGQSLAMRWSVDIYLLSRPLGLLTSTVLGAMGLSGKAEYLQHFYLHLL